MIHENDKKITGNVDVNLTILISGRWSATAKKWSHPLYWITTKTSTTDTSWPPYSHLHCFWPSPLIITLVLLTCLYSYVILSVFYCKFWSIWILAKQSWLDTYNIMCRNVAEVCIIAVAIMA